MTTKKQNYKNKIGNIAILFTMGVIITHGFATTPTPKQEAMAGEIIEAVQEYREQIEVQAEPVVLDDPTELEPVNQNLEAQKKKWAERIEAFILEVNSPLKGYGNAFVDIALRYGYHPYTAVAIAQADTSMGKHLTTPYNIGNVGNSDSCPTCGTHTKSWEQGIESIYQTLTNKYLGRATKLCHLSRGGWKDCPEGATLNGGKFYASSLENWHRNSAWTFSWLEGTAINFHINIKLQYD
jgi:hypothetical protein